MKMFKSSSKEAFMGLTILFLLVSSNIFAQNAKVIAIKGTDEMRFSVENIQATPGQKLTVKLSNDSKFAAAAMSHNFVLLKQSADAEAFNKAAIKHADNGYIAPELENQIIAHTGMVAGGKTLEVTFNAPKKPGKYVYICTFPGHFGAGMKGTLTVK